MTDRRPSYLNFKKAAYPWRPDIDYRAHPELYRMGKGEQGVLICQPYKAELSPLWRFKTPALAHQSSQQLLEKFYAYLNAGDFVGADLARKYLQMGFTRARRYANYKGGKKYDAQTNHTPLPRGTGDPQKAESADIFYTAWQQAEADPVHTRLKQQWKQAHG